MHSWPVPLGRWEAGAIESHTFNPKPEVETALLWKVSLETVLTFELGEPLLSRTHKRSLVLEFSMSKAGRQMESEGSDDFNRPTDGGQNHEGFRAHLVGSFTSTCELVFRRGKAALVLETGGL